MRTKTIIALASLSCALLGSAQATAQTSGSEANRVAYQKARDAMVAQDWRSANRILNELWAKSRTYDVALSLGQVELNLEQYRDSAEHLSFGLRNLPPKEKSDLEAKALAGLEYAKKRVGTLHVTVDRPGASVLIDGIAAGTSPLLGELFVTPGPHAVEARLNDRAPAKQTFQVTAGETRTIDLKFAAPALLFGGDAVASGAPAARSGPSDAPHAKNHTNQARTIALWSGVGVTAVAASVGLIFALKGASANSEAEDAAAQLPPGSCQPPSASSLCSDLSQAYADRDSANQTANVSFVIAGVAAVATATMFLVWPKSTPASAARIHVLPLATRESGGLTIHATF
jgi:hypothetical protein